MERAQMTLLSCPIFLFVAKMRSKHMMASRILSFKFSFSFIHGILSFHGHLFNLHILILFFLYSFLFFTCSKGRHKTPPDATASALLPFLLIYTSCSLWFWQGVTVDNSSLLRLSEEKRLAAILFYG